MKTRPRNVSLTRALAAGLGAPLASLGLCSGIALLPLTSDLAFAIGAHLVVPTWAVLACALPLARTGAHAWAGVGAFFAAGLVAAAVGGPQ